MFVKLSPLTLVEIGGLKIVLTQRQAQLLAARLLKPSRAAPRARDERRRLPSASAASGVAP